ncbi:MAG: HAD family phosphatase [bacterium]|nr:HAD family phosphatase [bacterium]
MPIAFVFDFGGVLMKTADYAPRHAWDKRLGLTVGSVEKIVHNADSWVRAQKGEISPSAYWDDVARQLGLSHDDVQQLAHDFYSGDVLDMSLIALIEKLRQEGYIVGLLSNDSLELEDKLHRLNIHHLFDPLLISAKLGMMKPNPAIYQHLLTSLPSSSYPVVFVDDRIDNIHGAIKAGMVGVFYQPKLDVEKNLRDLIDAHRKKMG